MKNDLIVSDCLTAIYRLQIEASLAHRDQAEMTLLNRLKKIEALATAARGHVEEVMFK